MHPTSSQDTIMCIPIDIEKNEKISDEKNFDDNEGDPSEAFSLENHPPTSHCSQTSKNSALPTTSSVLNLVSTGTELVNLEDQRIADLCCGVCCDLVKACVVVNVCDIGMSIIQIALPALGYTDFFIDTINFDAFAAIDDDELLESVQGERALNTFVMVMTVCGILFSVIGIVGAMKFHKCMVLATAIWYCIDVVRCAVTLHWLNIFANGCYAYPHIALFLALRSGKITRERYHIEKHCCCV